MAPRESTREFLIYGSDYGSDYGFATMAQRIGRIAREKAPGVSFRFQPHDPRAVEDAGSRLRSVDAMMVPHGFLDELPFQDLWRDRWVVIAAADTPVVGDRLAMVQAGLVSALCPNGLRVHEPPFDATPVLNALWWHPVHARDPEHGWMLQVFAEAAGELSVDQWSRGSGPGALLVVP